jgi:hypothetical protein
MAESTQRILVRFIAISLRDGLSLSKYLSEREVPKTWTARIPLRSRPGGPATSGIRRGKQDPLFSGGNAYLAREFPRLDFIRRARVVEGL